MSSTSTDQPTFRTAQVEEDEWLSRILSNAFLPLWNHNWFHGVSEPLSPVDTEPSTVHTQVAMPRISDVRRRLYFGLIKITRAIDGQVLVAEVSGEKGEKDVGAIMLWLPPQKRMPEFSPVLLYQTGFLSLMLPWNYGIRGFYRVDQIFEANVKRMFTETLKPRGIKWEECGFIQMIAANPRHAGKGYASTLLDWQMKEHFKTHPQAPITLDTTTEQGIRAYIKLGFELLAETAVDTGTDAKGIKLKSDASQDVKEQAKKICVQRVMIRMPPGASD